jgi:thymidylate synthase
LELANEMGIKWWDEFDVGDKTIGKRYGYTVAKHNLIDNLLHGLESRPFSKRHVMSLWQNSDFEEGKGLVPCAFLSQATLSVTPSGEKEMDFVLFQRSCDYLMAGYINKIQYVALQLMLCAHIGAKPRFFTHFVTDLHIYDRHIESAEQILATKPLEENFTLGLKVNRKNFYDITIDDFIFPDLSNVKNKDIKLEIAVQ